MTYLTAKEAKSKPCPFARTFDKKVGPNCEGENCILWRWRDLSVDDHRVLSAWTRVQTEMMADELAKNPDTKKTATSFHKAAVAKVAAAPWDFMFWDKDDRGWCGMGGKP